MSSSNTRQAFWFSIGSLFSALVAMVGPMIVARYWTKNDYGTYKQVMYVYNTLLFIFTLGLPKAYSYFIPKIPLSQCRSLINKITNIFTVLGLLFTILLFCGSNYIANFLNNEELDFALKIFSPVPLFLLPVMGMESVFAAFRKSQFMAIYTIITRVLTILFTIIPVICFNGNYIQSLIGFNVASALTLIIALYMRNIPIKTKEYVKTSITYSEILSFSLPLFSATIWGFIIASTDQFFISRYFGDEVFADFSNGFIELPFISMVINTVAAVLLPIFSKQKFDNVDKSEMINLWNSTLKKTILLTYPMSIFCIVFSSLIMICMYGDLYSNSGVYFLIKNILGLFIILPFQPIILALDKVKAYSRIHFISAILVVVLEYFVLKTFFSAIAIAIVSVLCQLFKFILQLRIISSEMKVSTHSLIPIKYVIKVFIPTLITAIITYLYIYTLPINNKFILLILAFGVFIIIYYVLCFLFKISYKPIIVGILGNRNIIKYIP